MESGENVAGDDWRQPLLRVAALESPLDRNAGGEWMRDAGVDERTCPGIGTASSVRGGSEAWDGTVVEAHERAFTTRCGGRVPLMRVDPVADLGRNDQPRAGYD